MAGVVPAQVLLCGSVGYVVVCSGESAIKLTVKGEGEFFITVETIVEFMAEVAQGGTYYPPRHFQKQRIE